MITRFNISDPTLKEKIKKLKNIYNIRTTSKLIVHIINLEIEKHLITKE